MYTEITVLSDVTFFNYNVNTKNHSNTSLKQQWKND